MEICRGQQAAGVGSQGDFLLRLSCLKDVEPSPLGDEEGKVVLLALGNEISSLSPVLGWFCLW